MSNLICRKVRISGQGPDVWIELSGRNIWGSKAALYLRRSDTRTPGIYWSDMNEELVKVQPKDVVTRKRRLCLSSPSQLLELQVVEHLFAALFILGWHAVEIRGSGSCPFAGTAGAYLHAIDPEFLKVSDSVEGIDYHLLGHTLKQREVLYTPTNYASLDLRLQFSFSGPLGSWEQRVTSEELQKIVYARPPGILKPWQKMLVAKASRLGWPHFTEFAWLDEAEKLSADDLCRLRQEVGQHRAVDILGALYAFGIWDGEVISRKGGHWHDVQAFREAVVSPSS